MAIPRWVVLPVASLMGLSAARDVAAQDAPSAPLANLCLSAEYIYAGSRLLAIAPGPLPEVKFAAANSTPDESGAVAPAGVIVTTIGGCPTIGGAISVQYSTGPGTATPGLDYTPVPPSPPTYLHIPAGTASGTILPLNIAVVNDQLDENDETFAVSLLGVSGATLGLANHTVTIVDDDPKPRLKVSDGSLTEPDTRPATITHTVTLEPVSGREVTVHFGTADGTAIASDYTGASGVFTFPPGTTEHSFNVAVHPDDLDEPSESYFVNLTDPVNADPKISDLQGQGTINDSASDLPPTISVSPASTFEGDDGVNRTQVSVSLSRPSGFEITVHYATSDGSASAPSDYLATSGQLTLAVGAGSGQAEVQIITDSVAEPNERFFLNLSNPEYAVLGTAQAPVLINNDDPQFLCRAALLR